MNSDSETAKSGWPWWWHAIFLTIIVGFLAAIRIPNYIGGGPSKLNGIINTLRQIDGAKSEWAIEHGFTNASDMRREVTKDDVAAFVKHGNIDKSGIGFDENGYAQGGKDVVYSINLLGAPPDAKFTRDYRERDWPSGWKIPGGTRIIFVGMEEKYILPGQESQLPKSLDQILPLSRR